MLAAGFIVGNEASLVASANLMHLNSRSESTGQMFHQRAEIDALLGHEKESGHFAAEQQFDLDELHGQIELANELLAGGDVIGSAGLHGSLARVIFDRGDAD